MRLDYVARPAGTKPAAVYWRRRFVVFGVLLLLVWFAAKACGGSGSGSSASHAVGASQSAKAQPSAPASAQPTGGNGTVPSAAAVGTPGDTASGSSVQPRASASAVTARCDGSSLSLRAAVDRLSFHRPFTAGITLQIATRSANPCGLDAGSLRAQVLDGSHVLWSSDGCPAAGSTATTGGAATPGGGSAVGGTTASTTSTNLSASPAGTNPSAAGAGNGNLITVPSQAAADQHFTWHGNVCSGQLAPGRYDVIGRLGLAQAFAGTVTIS